MNRPAEKMVSQSEIEVGRAVLKREIEGLQALTDSLDARFTAAVELIYHLKGRLIISGMGKSGHVARKIAATMASTGTPAHFVHPGEASHGDLGMVTKDDGLLLLSNSGETAELRDIIGYAKRFSIPLIGMVRRQTSMLVDAADIALVLPETPEASPTGAPTTSTTMMLALGDALAVALIEKRGFTPEDFQVYHPGGKLGQRFIRVADLMHGAETQPLVDMAAPMSDVLQEITAKKFGCTGVVEKGVLKGIITDGDLRRHMSNDMLHKKARDVMTRDPKTVRASALAEEAVNIMNTRSITTLFVCEEGKPVGILHIHDCLRAGIV
jgi:arabinose-5-phosphate isomerase